MTTSAASPGMTMASAAGAAPPVKQPRTPPFPPPVAALSASPAGITLAFLAGAALLGTAGACNTVTPLPFVPPPLTPPPQPFAPVSFVTTTATARACGRCVSQPRLPLPPPPPAPLPPPVSFPPLRRLPPPPPPSAPTFPFGAPPPRSLFPPLPLLPPPPPSPSCPPPGLSPLLRLVALALGDTGLFLLRTWPSGKQNSGRSTPWSRGYVGEGCRELRRDERKDQAKPPFSGAGCLEVVGTINSRLWTTGWLTTGPLSCSACAIDCFARPWRRTPYAGGHVSYLMSLIAFSPPVFLMDVDGKTNATYVAIYSGVERCKAWRQLPIMWHVNAGKQTTCCGRHAKVVASTVHAARPPAQRTCTALTSTIIPSRRLRRSPHIST